MHARPERAFELLVLWFYPATFATRFASEIAGVFAQGYAEARVHGRVRALLFSSRELSSLAQGALVAQAEDRSPRKTLGRRALTAVPRLLDSRWAPAALATAALLAVSANASDAIATRGLYWHATQIALVVTLAGLALRLGVRIAKEPRAILRSTAIVSTAILAMIGIALVSGVDELTSLAAATGARSFQSSLPGVFMLVVTGPEALAGNDEPPVGFNPTRIHTRTTAHGDLAVRTQLFARGVDLAYALLTIALLCGAAAGGFRFERHRHRLA